MKKILEILFAVAILAAFVAARGPALKAPFVLPFETAFQESIALHHRANGVKNNNYLPVAATIGGENFYHTAHPPLLHIIYDRIYHSPLKVREWKTRLYSLGLFFMSVALWRSMLGRTRRAWIIYPIAFALPIPFLLSTTTNYEPLSIFFISLIGRLGLSRRPRLWLLVPAVAVGALVDWPVYLAVPALLVVMWRAPEARKRLLALLGLESVIFAALQWYQYSVAGEAAFFSHAPNRANPLALFDPGLWRELSSHFIEVMGGPLSLVAVAAVAVTAVSCVRGTGAEVDDHRSVHAERLLLLFPAILIIAAPRLVSRHYVYLLYLAPAVAVALRRAIVNTDFPVVALLALLTLCGARDYVINQARNPAYFGMADRIRSAEVKTAFASAAVGHWRYYNKIETVHPVSAKGADWIKTNRPDLIHLDLRHGEVAHLKDVAGDGYRMVFSIPGEAVYVREELASSIPEYLMVPSSTFILTGPGEVCKAGTWIQTRPYYGANVTSCKVPSYAIHEPPGPSGAALSVPIDKEFALNVKPAIVHALPTARSDGVTFVAMARYDSGKDGAAVALLYSRFVAGPGPAEPSEINFKSADELILATTPGPRMNASFDDAYWLEPTVERGP